MSDIPYKSPSTQMTPDKGAGSLTRIGGGLGVAASIIGIALFMAACAGFDAALMLSFLPAVLGLAGLVLAVLGGVYQKNPEDTHVMGAMFASALGVIGGVVMMAAWLQWPVFHR